MKILTKQIKIYEYSDLLKNKNLLEKCHNNWLQDENNIPYCAEENLDGLKNFLTELNFSLVNYSLSNSEYGDRGDFLQCEFSYYDSFNNNKEILDSITDKIKNYTPILWIDDVLKDFRLKYLELKLELNDLELNNLELEYNDYKLKLNYNDLKLKLEYNDLELELE